MSSPLGRDPKGMTETFSQIGGARIGGGIILAFNATWPFAKLTIGRSNLTLRCIFQEWIFPRAAIRKLSDYGGGLRIEHDIKHYNGFIVFWTLRFEQLRQELQQRGYKVS